MIIMNKLLLLCIIVVLFSFIQPVSAVINVNATSVGTTYIEWTWDNGLNLTDIFIDGSVICGYETTNSSIIYSDLNPNELHSITVYTSTDAGSNSTFTLFDANCTNTTPWCPYTPPTLTNSTLMFNPDISNVMTNGNAYVSMKVYYVMMALFVLFILASLFLDGASRPFEKLFMSVMAFLTSVIIALSSFSLAIISFINGGTAQQAMINNTTFQQQYTIPTIIMQNSPVIQIVSWILVILCFINIINCILNLIAYSKVKPIKKRKEF